MNIELYMLNRIGYNSCYGVIPITKFGTCGSEKVERRARNAWRLLPRSCGASAHFLSIRNGKKWDTSTAIYFPSRNRVHCFTDDGNCFGEDER